VWQVHERAGPLRGVPGVGHEQGVFGQQSRQAAAQPSRPDRHGVVPAPDLGLSAPGRHEGAHLGQPAVAPAARGGAGQLLQEGPGIGLHQLGAGEVASELQRIGIHLHERGCRAWQRPA
jgi:hypothetical protein